MPKKLKLEPHQNLGELEKLYRQASDPIQRTRLQIIWLLAKGYPAQEVAKVTGYQRGSIYKIVSRYNKLYDVRQMTHNINRMHLRRSQCQNE